MRVGFVGRGQPPAEAALGHQVRAAGAGVVAHGHHVDGLHAPARGVVGGQSLPEPLALALGGKEVILPVVDADGGLNAGRAHHVHEAGVGALGVTVQRIGHVGGSAPIDRGGRGVGAVADGVEVIAKLVAENRAAVARVLALGAGDLAEGIVAVFPLGAVLQRDALALAGRVVAVAEGGQGRATRAGQGVGPLLGTVLHVVGLGGCGAQHAAAPALEAQRFDQPGHAAGRVDLIDELDALSGN